MIKYAIKTALIIFIIPLSSCTKTGDGAQSLINENDDGNDNENNDDNSHGILNPTDPGAHYNPQHSGRSKTARDPNDKSKAHPLYNTYSRWIHERSFGAYGFSLDDDEGLKACQSPTLNNVACPVCIPDEKGTNCKLPSKGMPDPVSKTALTTIPTVDPTLNPTVYKPAQSYLRPSWLTVAKFDATKGSIDTDFSTFPDNNYYTQNPTITREHPYHVAFNVANQSGLANSTCKMPVPIWVTIDVGSPNIILAYQKVNPGEGYQLIVNMFDDNLRKLLALRPALPNPYISGPLVWTDGVTRCAAECNATEARNIMESDCQDLLSNQSATCASTDNQGEFPTGKSYCECPTTKAHCNPNYKILNGQCYDLRFADDAQPTGFPHPPPCSPCYVSGPAMCEDLNNPNTPACCFSDSYSASTYSGATSCKKGNYFDWQLGGGRIIISYVDPATQEGIAEDSYRHQPISCAVDPNNCDPNISASWNALTAANGAKMAAIEQDNFAALLEFTVDYYLNVPGPDGFKGPVIYYDISTVDSLNFPVYMKAVGNNQNPQEKCVTNGGQCCFSYIGTPKHYVDTDGGTLKQGCPTDIYANKDDENKTVPWWGNCVAAYGYCANREVGASGIKTTDRDICNVWNNFENESPAFAKYKEFLNYDSPLNDQPTIERFAEACGDIWISKKFIKTKNEAENFAARNVLWPNENSCRTEFVNDSVCCEPRMKDYVNNVIWGCETASAGKGNKSDIKINNEKCRSMNWGVYPNYSYLGGQIIGSIDYERPPELLTPAAFKCNLESCDVSYANKPYNGSLESMMCMGKDDSSMCCNETESTFCWGITKPE